MNKNIIIFVIVLASCVYLGSALKCYECTELSGANGIHCKDPFDGQASIKTCFGEEVCLKQSTPEITVGNNVISPMVTRGCGSKSLCDSKMEELSVYCGDCATDLCNSAITVVPSFIVFILYIVKCIFL